MWERLFDAFVDQSIRFGTLEITMPEGDTRRYGDGTGKTVAIAISDRDTIRRIAISPELGVGEAYMDGRLTIDGDDLHGLLSLATRNVAAAAAQRRHRPVQAFRRLRGKKQSQQKEARTDKYKKKL
eukprot:TRINITY_DN8995_c0_g2_i1.p5 TRINITY_DN8995_c0_g2~~TRINITY_DN8995_c0_g2_i1.p5  ORF type:complete len:126 (-),score=22.05 TRINITY_DN8995_c0_g2_i1:60-437(-)